MPKEVNRAIISAAITVGLVLVVISLLTAATSLLSAIAFPMRPWPAHLNISAADTHSKWLSVGARIVFDAIQVALGIAIVSLGMHMGNQKSGLPTSDGAATSIVSTAGYRVRGLGALALAGLFFLWSAGHTTAAVLMMQLAPQTQLAMSHMLLHPGFFRIWSSISDTAIAAAYLCAIVALINLAARLFAAARAGARPAEPAEGLTA